MSYIPKPKPCFLDGLQKFRVINGRQVYKEKDKFYSWDELHGEIEVFDSRGRHLMVIDPQGEHIIKDAVRGRRIDV